MTCDTKQADRLNVEAAVNLLSRDGPFSAFLKGFESRQEQQMMMRNVLEAYNRSHIALIEAGTGTGKSLAYLIPAMLWAAQTKERTVISTNTITLQEQLLNKDIPLIEKSLGLDVKAVLVKGMHNYVCLRKLDESLQEALLFPPGEAEELQKMDAWRERTHDGSRSALPFSVSSATWEKVAAESDACNRNNCTYYQDCYFFKARRQANESQILIVNHHLLFADLAYKAENDNLKDAGILPAYSRVVLDEAHNIEDIATEYFATKISHMDVIRLMGRLAAEKGTRQHGKLPLLKEKLIHHYRNDFSKEISSIHNRLTIDLPGLRRDLLQQTHEFFSCFSEFVQKMQNRSGNEEMPLGESKLRILPFHHTHPYWSGMVIPLGKQLIIAFQRYCQSLTALEMDLKQLNNPQLDEQIKGIIFEINALKMRLNTCWEVFDNFIKETAPGTKVRWIELQPLKTMINIALVDADLDISKKLVDYLFSRFSTIILCSATLTTNKHFNFIRSRLGLAAESFKHRGVKEYIYASPFNFSKQALLAVPTDLPSPTDPAFTEIAADRIWTALQSSRGNAFVLFTSYSMLKICFGMLEKRLQDHRFHPLKQGDDDRQVLLSKFKETDRSVLFGTDSFWEGVDVAGDALRCVIIVKIPFKVPSEPLIQARSEAIVAQGGDPFIEYALPQAIVKFKQGFGRLIRNQRDRGCIVCLDNRVLTKAYGKQILSSLPDCQQIFISSIQLQQQMADFYRKTHFLVSGSR